MPNADLFLSHSSGDADVARELRAELEAAGYSCWMAPDDVVGTDPWAEQILAAIEGSKAMLVLLSANANRSPHVSREVNLAIGRKRAVLPVRIENVTPEASLEYLLSLMQRVDAFPPPIANHRDRILRRVAAIVPVTGTTPVVEPLPLTAPMPSESPADVATELMTASASGPVGAESAAAAEGAFSEPVQPTTPPLVPVSGQLPAGTRIGAFTIESTVGEGGMATVYRASQEEPRRRVALKVIRADHAADPNYRQRFLAEKDTLAALEHPSIVPIYAAGEAAGVLYIALRLIDGPDLAGHLRDGPMSVRDTVATLRPIGEAVDYAHEMGIVHRDLKPSNILLDRSRRPYLTDFGLGKQLDKSLGLSAPGIALGTLAYMAPEQFTGLAEAELAGRIDVYALACVAYECITGRPPFDGATPERLMYAHLHEPLRNRPGISDAVETVFKRALAKNPDDRYATAIEFVDALAAAESLSAVQTTAIAAPAFGQPQRIGAWARANSALTGVMVAFGLLLTLSLGAFGLGLVSNESSPTPGGSLTGAGSSPVPTPSVAPSPLPTVPDETGFATDPPTQPPTGSPTPSPDEGPTPKPDGPTPKPDDGPTPSPRDLTPPTNIDVAIKGKDLKTTKIVTVSLDASGASQMQLGRASSRNGSCAWEGWRRFDRSIAFDLKGGGDAGPRWVCAKFRDAAGNESGTVRDGVVFDNPPVATTNIRFKATCDGSEATYHLLDGGAPYAASDPDGRSTLEIVDAWATSPHNGELVSFKSGITEDGNSITAWFGAGKDWTIKFVVEDHLGVRDQGSFKIDCEPWA